MGLVVQMHESIDLVMVAGRRFRAGLTGRLGSKVNIDANFCGAQPATSTFSLEKTSILQS
jgi:hypothetical protein